MLASFFSFSSILYVYIKTNIMDIADPVLIAECNGDTSNMVYIP